MGSHLDKYLIPRLGSLPLAAIDERRVQELRTDMERVEYTRSDGAKKRLSPKSIRNVIGVLKLLLGKKVWHDWNLVFPENIDPDKEQRYFTQAEMIQIVNAAGGQWKVSVRSHGGIGLANWGSLWPGDRRPGSGGRTHSRAPWNPEGQGNHAEDEEREANCVYRAHSRCDALFVS